MAISNLRTKKEQFNPVVFPPPNNPPIPELRAPRTDGLQCEFNDNKGEPCQFIACQVRNIQKHCSKEHGWDNPQEGGRPQIGAEVEVPWRTGVHCQHFFVRGPGAEYFEVARVEDSREAIEQEYSGFEFNQQEIQELIKKAEEAEREIKEPDVAREPNPWLERVGWAVHFQKFDPKVVRQLVEQPGEEEDELQLLGLAFKGLIQDAQYDAVRSVVGIQALFEANKKEADKEPSMPFNSWMDITTIHAYVDVWKRLLFYIYRVEQMEDKDKQPKYKLTEKQRERFDEMQLEIECFQEWKEEQDPNQGEESEEQTKHIGQIQHRVLQFCIELLDHPIGDNEYDSAIISGLAALGLREDNKWLDAEDYTPKYSAVVKLARLMVIKKACIDRQKSIQFHRSRGDNESVAKRKAGSIYRLVGKSVYKFTTMAHSGRNPTPMHWIYHTRTYGFKIRYSTTAKANIQWIGDDVLYPGIRFHVSKVRRLVQGLVHEARELLFNELMMVGMNIDKEVCRKCPKIDWDNIVDQPSESQVGWSFLDDERNKFPVCGKWWLLKRVCEEQKLKGKFMDQEGKWKESVWRTYSERVERFKELLLLMMHFTGMWLSY
jgi:hypothetical protein